MVVNYSQTIDVYLQFLRENESSVLKKIDEDRKLSKREIDGLVIANASAALFTPEEDHQIYAKGIIYTRHPYRLISLPLIKMYNYGEIEEIQHLTDRLFRDERYRPTILLKEDGFLVQFFEHDGRVYVSTRGLLEGMTEPEWWDYVGNARRIAEEKYPALLDISTYSDGKTVICEGIHPKADGGVALYGQREDLVVLSVYSDYRYWTYEQTKAYALSLNCIPVSCLLENPESYEAVQKVVNVLENDPAVPEGVVLCFEDASSIVHRVKIKTQTWLELFRWHYHCTPKGVFHVCLENPENVDWKIFEKMLREMVMDNDDLIEKYRLIHKDFLRWVGECRDTHRRITTEFSTFLESMDKDLDEKDKDKVIAMHFQQASFDKRDFSLYMTAYRNPENLIELILKQTCPVKMAFQNQDYDYSWILSY
jgi:hypothetical protein